MGNSPFGGTGKGHSGKTGKESERTWQEYFTLKTQIHESPLMRAAEEAALGFLDKSKGPERDYFGMGMAQGARQADIASRDVRRSLAGRGGGDLASAIAMGTEARAGSALAGLTTGAGLEQQAWLNKMNQLVQSSNLLNQVLTNKFGLINQAYGAASGVGSAFIGAQGQMGAAGYGMWGDIVRGAAGAAGSGGG